MFFTIFLINLTINSNLYYAFGNISYDLQTLRSTQITRECFNNYLIPIDRRRRKMCSTMFNNKSTYICYYIYICICLEIHIYQNDFIWNICIVTFELDSNRSEVKLEA